MFNGEKFTGFEPGGTVPCFELSMEWFLWLPFFHVYRRFINYYIPKQKRKDLNFPVEVLIPSVLNI